MVIRIFLLTLFFFGLLQLSAQVRKDTSVNVEGRMIRLSEIVINSKLNVPSFITRVRNDTSFYKAFRTLHILGFSALNDIRMINKGGNIRASLHSKIRQTRKNDCRYMEVLEETINGDMYDDKKNFNYYTGEMYAGLFFTKDSICGEDNIVKGHEFTTAGVNGMDKHKQQLKMLFFNPGRKISGIPLMGNKTAIFDENMENRYDMSIDMVDYNKTSCYLFKIKAKEGHKMDVVIDEMSTWFNDKTFEIVARTYAISFDAGVYDFDVQMHIEMTKFDHYLIPSLIRYVGNWKAIFKKRERGVFTATLFDFTKPK